MIQQTTIARPVTITGIGLHSGNQITMHLRPAEAGCGIIFHRREGERVVGIEALSANVVDTRLATVLGKDGLTVSTVEHLLGALSALGIDNLNIDIDGPEIPVMDGSAGPFVTKLLAAGVRKLARSRKYLVVDKPVWVNDGDKSVRIEPSRFFRVSCTIAFAHPSIGQQSRSVKVTPETFCHDIASARTFGFLHEVEYLKSQGLARGGSLDNAVVLSQERVLNSEGLRHPDEFVRHKILDSIGDASLVGYPILGHIKAHKPGHDLNHRLAEALLARTDAWHLATFERDDNLSLFHSGMQILGPELTLSKA